MICLHLVCESWWEFWVTVLVTTKPHLRLGIGRDMMETAGANTLCQLYLPSFLYSFLSFFFPYCFILPFSHRSSLGPFKSLSLPFQCNFETNKSFLLLMRSWESEPTETFIKQLCVLILQLSCHCHFLNRWRNWFSKVSNALLSNIHVHLFLTRQLYLSSPLASRWLMTSSC